MTHEKTIYYEDENAEHRKSTISFLDSPGSQLAILCVSTKIDIPAVILTVFSDGDTDTHLLRVRKGSIAYATTKQRVKDVFK